MAPRGSRTPAYIVTIAACAAILTLPVLQMATGLVPATVLAGVQTLEPRPDPNLRDWFSGDLQATFERWFSQHFGLREHLIRTNNQIHYSLFRESGANGEGIVVGRGGWLFGWNYIEAALPLAPPGDFTRLVGELTEIQSRLAGRGVSFIVLLTPNKASLYADRIPGRLAVKTPWPFNGTYRRFVGALRERGVNLVDGHTIIEDLKRQKAPPLFPRGGLHWTSLGAWYVTDNLLDLIERLTDRQLARPRLTGIRVDRHPYDSDTDAANLLNLWKPPLNYPTARPVLEPRDQRGDFRPRVLFEGGSFTWLPLEILAANGVCSELTFYYYFKTRLEYRDSPRPSAETKLGEIDWVGDVLDRDVIILEVNEMYLTQDPAAFANGFPRRLLEHLRERDPRSGGSRAR
jgi:hypothetical protein